MGGDFRASSRRAFVYPPYAGGFILLLFMLLLIITFLIPILIMFAFHELGIPFWLTLFILWASLIGSLINIPLKEIRTGRYVERMGIVSFYGIPYYVPRIEEEKLVIAINVGGGIIPLLVSAYVFGTYLMGGDMALIAKGLINIGIVTLITYKFSKIVEGVGIAVPAFIPPLISTIVALSIAWESPYGVAYVGGTLGTLIGADLLNLPKITKLKAPVVSIGGAGTFDGIFLSGVIALILVLIIH